VSYCKKEALIPQKMGADDMRKILAEMDDFKNEKSLIERYLISKGHIPVFLPKFHPELLYESQGLEPPETLTYRGTHTLCQHTVCIQKIFLPTSIELSPHLMVAIHLSITLPTTLVSNIPRTIQSTNLTHVLADHSLDHSSDA